VIGLLPNIFAEAAQPQGIAALGLDPWGFLAQAVTFLILLWGIKKFALTKIVNVLEERRITIDKGVRLGIEMEKEKAQLDDKVDDLLQQARQQSDKIIAQGQEEARELIRQAEEAANRKAEAVLEEAQNQLAEDVKRAKTQLQSEMIELVGQATSIIIGEKVDARKDAQLIQRALEEVR
jgi:F-type H+-transporting ATPase subunit b